MNTHTAFLLAAFAAFAALATACGVTEVPDSPDSDPVDGTEDAADAPPAPDGSDGETGTAGCPWVGDLDLDDDAMREAFELSGCDVVHGDVLFVGSARDAIPATSLRRVVGNVIVSCNENLRSLDGLASLEKLLGTDRDGWLGVPHPAELAETATPGHGIHFGGTLLVGTAEQPSEACSQAALVDLHGISSLLYIDHLIVRWNLGLTSLQGVETIVSAGSISISHNPVLLSVDHFSSLIRLSYGLQIEDNGCLTDEAARLFLGSYNARASALAPEQFLLLRNGEDCPAAEGSGTGR